MHSGSFCIIPLSWGGAISLHTEEPPEPVWAARLAGDKGFHMGTRGRSRL